MNHLMSRLRSLAQTLVTWPLWQRPWVAILLTGGAVALGWGVLWWATALWGIGANSDGLSYLILARSLYRGLGYGYPALDGGVKPMTHFPPGYPWAISVFMPFTGGDPARAALILNALSLAGLILLIGGLTFALTRHAFPAAGLAAGVAVALPLYRIYPVAFSETLFLPGVLLVGWALGRWQRSPSWGWALVIGLLSAWLTYVRWIGLAVLLWALMDISLTALARRRWQFLGYVALAGVGGLVPLGALVMTNRLRAGSATNRALVWHPPTPEKWQQAREALWAWMDPLTQWLVPHERSGLLAVVLYLAAMILVGAAYQRARHDPEGSRLRAHLRRWILFGGIYVGSVIAAIALLDASTPLDWRLLIPVFPALALLVGPSLWFFLRRIPVGVLVALVLGVALVYTNLRYDKRQLAPLHYHGGWLRAARWQKAAIWPALRNLPPETQVFTNEFEETIYYADRPAQALIFPVIRQGQAYFCDPVTEKCQEASYRSLTDWAEQLRHDFRRDCVAIAYVAVQEKESHSKALRQALEQVFLPVYQDDSGLILAPPDMASCLSP